MNKSNSIEAIDKTDLSEQTKFRVDEISNIKNILSKKLIKENHVVKNQVNTLLFLIILTKPELF